MAAEAALAPSPARAASAAAEPSPATLLAAQAGALVRGEAVVEDTFAFALEPGAPLPAGDVVVPLSRLEEAIARGGRVGVWIDNGEDVRALKGRLDRVALVVLPFPSFREGRPYSHARILREELGYPGPLRAIGDVQRDQLYFMRRCGFDELHLKQGQDVEGCLAGLRTYTVRYQGAADERDPLFRQGRR